MAVGFQQLKQDMRELMSAPPGNYLLTTARDPKHVNRVLIEMKRANKKCSPVLEAWGQAQHRA